jgi:predicted phage terminase large subunit-like protein
MSPVHPAEVQARIEQIARDRERARTDKIYLANEVLGYTFQPDVHQELFDQLLPMNPSKPLIALDDKKDRLILWPRGHYKSTAMTVECIQLLLNYPDIRICIMRSTLRLSREWLNEIAGHFTGEAQGSRLGELFPEFCGTRKQLKLTADKFISPARKQKQLRQASVFVASFTSDTTGNHMEVLISDDQMTKDNYQKPERLEKVITGFWALTPQVEPGFYKYVVGTRYAHGDLYDDIIRKNTNGNWIVTIKDCWTDDGEGVRFPQRTVKLKSGYEKTIGFTRELLAQIQQDDPEMFCCQYLNRPAIESSTNFNESMFTNALVDPELAPVLSSSVLFIDTAATTGTRSDDSVILCGKSDGKGTTYLVDGIGGQWEPEALALNVISMTIKHRPQKVMIEKTASALNFVVVLRLIATEKGVHIPVDFLPSDNKKDAKIIRVKGVATYLTRNRLKIFRNLPCFIKMQRQFLNFTGTSHDDYADTVAFMCNFFSGNVQPIQPHHSKNSMIDLLVRDTMAEQMRRMEQTQDWDRYAGGMGDDFAC